MHPCRPVRGILHPSLRRSLLAAAAVCVGLFAAAGEGSAQTPTESEFVGTVRTPAGEPIQRAVITLHDAQGRAVRSVEGGLDGRFMVRGMGMGRYDLRVEALGFRPRVVTGVTLRPGETTRLAVVLEGGGAGVDTVAAPGGSGARALEWWTDARTLVSLPAETPALDRRLSLATTVGDGFGMTGLPGAHTTVFIDGLPFRPVLPLGMRESGRALGIVTARSAGSVQVAPGLDGFTLPAGAGGRISVHTARGGEAESRVDGVASGGGMRQGGPEGEEVGGTLSIQAGGLASLTAETSGTRVAIGADAWQVERPRLGFAPRGGDEPSHIEQERGAVAFARVDHPVEGGTLWGMGRLGIQPATTDYTGMAWGGVDSGERIDFLAGGGLMAPVGRREVLDVRLGVGRSGWGSAVSGDAALAPVQLLDPQTGLRRGAGPVHVESASRLDVDLTGTLVMDRGAHRFLVGARGGVTAHKQDLGSGEWTTYRVGGQDADGAWASSFESWRYRGEVDATVPRFGVVAEDRWAASPEVELHFGAAFDSEWVPILDIFPNSDWFIDSGLGALTRDVQMSAFSGFGNLVWGGGTGTEFRVGGAYESHPFDPALVMEILSSVDNAVSWGTHHHSAGHDAGWPELPSSPPQVTRSVPGVAYLVKGPTAPSTVRFGAGLTHLAGPLEISIGGLFRHSDGLGRRRDLNRAAIPHSVDPEGRALWAQPQQLSGWLGQQPETAGRLEQWGPVMELDQGGWSEYLGVTGRLTWRSTSGVQLSAAYTWSRTEDNIPGLGGQGVTIGVPLEAAVGDDVTAGVSDLDRPHRVTGQLAVPLPVGRDSRFSAVWRFMSGAPFTPGYTVGVDANLDGVVGNDPAWVGSAAAAAHEGWSCLRADAGGFATRNGCRAPDVQRLDLRLEVGLAQTGVGLFIDLLDALDGGPSYLDTALLAVDPAAAVSTVGGITTLPFVVNPGFGSPLVDRSTGRVLRVGLRVVR